MLMKVSGETPLFAVDAAKQQAETVEPTLKIPFSRFVNRLKIKHVLLLNALSSSPTIQGAAASIGISQPAASILLREIEDMIGVPLFERQRHGVQANKYGEATIRWAGVVLANLEHIRTELEALGAGHSGKLRVGLSVAVAPIFARVVTILRERYPALVVEADTSHDAKLLPALQCGELDVAFCRLVPDAMTSAFNHQIIYEDKASIVVGPNHPLRNVDADRALSVLDDFRWVLPPSSSFCRDLITRSLVLRGALPPRAVMETASTFILVQMLNEGNYLGTLPNRIARFYEERGEIAILPFDLLEKNYPTVALTRADDKYDFPERQAMVDVVKRVYGEHF
jgi:DNA-binding transcriptional LysR family regulator